MLEVKNGINPNNKLIIAVNTKPKVKNIRALLRSLTVPITNLLKPYAIDTADNPIPNSPLLKPCSINEGIAKEKFFLNK